MSGPVMVQDSSPDSAPETGSGEPVVEVTASRLADVGGVLVRRALPRRARRTVGAWCFADHMGLVSGELVHRDSLGSEQLIRPGQLNLMTAGHGVSHAEEPSGHYRGDLQGIQLWVAQPEATRHLAPTFEHHAQLPALEFGTAVASVIVGELEAAASPARRDTDHLGIELKLTAGQATLPLRKAHEYAIVVLEGAVAVAGTARDPAVPVVPGELAYLGLGRDEIEITARADARLILLGGAPFEAPILMWWNFVARTRQEVEDARADWSAANERFGETGSVLPRIGAPQTRWTAAPS